MKELIINQNDDKITLVDKNDILDALSEKTNKENIAQVINNDSNLGNGAFIHTDNSDEYNMSISSDKNIIQTDGTCNINATVKKGTTPVANKNVKFSDGTNTTYKKTNSSGVATYTYTGTGKGVTDIKAKYSNLLQETSVVIDANYYDSFSTDTSNRYWYDSSGGNSIAVTNDKLVLTLGTNRKYVQLRTQDSRSTLDIDDYLGKTVKFQCDCDTPSKTRMGIYYSLDGSTYINNAGTYGELSNTQEIPSDAQNILFRVDCTGGSSGDVFNIDNIVIYTI